MAMSDDEILREAARIRAGRRRRAAKRCARCGKSFVGIAQAKYCSDACRMAAAREQRAMAEQDSAEIGPVYIATALPGESHRDYIVRQRAKLVAEGKMTPEQAAISEEDEHHIAAWDELARVSEQLKGLDLLGKDSTEILREADEELNRRIAELHGWHGE